MLQGPTPSISPAAAIDPSLRDRRLAGEQAMFSRVLSQARARGPHDDQVAQTPKAQAREAAQGLVSQALVLPLLKRLRESSQAAPPFGPGKGEQMFRSLGDQQLADRLVSQGTWGLVERVEAKILERTAPPAPAQPLRTDLAAPARVLPLITDLGTRQTSPALVTDLRSQAQTPIRTRLEDDDLVRVRIRRQQEGLAP